MALQAISKACDLFRGALGVHRCFHAGEGLGRISSWIGGSEPEGPEVGTGTLMGDDRIWGGAGGGWGEGRFDGCS